MRVKVKGGKWKGLDKGPIALELTMAEKDMVAAAPIGRTLFVFGDDPGAAWAAEENPEPETKEPPKKKAAAGSKSKK